jgi:hypothetical protein
MHLLFQIFKMQFLMNTQYCEVIRMVLLTYAFSNKQLERAQGIRPG